MIRLRLSFAILLSLLLLGAQQAAVAHLIGHIGMIGVAADRVASFSSPDDAGHSEALALSDVCATCLGAAGFAAAAPHAVPPRLTFHGEFGNPGHESAALVACDASYRYLARAPPVTL